MRLTIKQKLRIWGKEMILHRIRLVTIKLMRFNQTTSMNCQSENPMTQGNPHYPQTKEMIKFTSTST